MWSSRKACCGLEENCSGLELEKGCLQFECSWGSGSGFLTGEGLEGENWGKKFLTCAGLFYWWFFIRVGFPVAGLDITVMFACSGFGGVISIP